MHSDFLFTLLRDQCKDSKIVEQEAASAVASVDT